MNSSAGNGWTGAQASLLRFGLGLAAAIQALVVLRGWEAGLGFPLALCVALGIATRYAALGAAAVWIWAALPTVAWPFALALPFEAPLDSAPLLSLAFIWVAVWPSAPFGSLAAIGRADPRGDWFLGLRFSALWWVVGSFCVWGGVESLRFGLARGDAWSSIPMQVGLAALVVALFGILRWTRPVAWLAFAFLLWTTYCGEARASVTWPGLWFLFALFDPAWIPARRGVLEIFYDGECALCQGSTRFAISEDRSESFRFGPQLGEGFDELVRERADDFPDSIVVRTEDDEVLVLSDAVLRTAEGLGGLWRVLGLAARRVPLRWRDAVYDRVAAVRLRMGVKASAICPAVGPGLAARFLP